MVFVGWFFVLFLCVLGVCLCCLLIDSLVLFVLDYYVVGVGLFVCDLDMGCGFMRLFDWIGFGVVVGLVCCGRFVLGWGCVAFCFVLIAYICFC